MDVVTLLAQDVTRQGRLPNGWKKTVFADGHRPKDATDVFLYGGSSTDARGGKARIADHEKEIVLPNRKVNSAHYEVARRPGAVYNFRLISLSPNPSLPSAPAAQGRQPEEGSFIITVEGTIMLFLNIAKKGDFENTFWPDHLSEFLAQIRQGVDGLPDLASHGLNRAWPLHQGHHRRHRLVCDHCHTKRRVVFRHPDLAKLDRWLCNICMSFYQRTKGQFPPPSVLHRRAQIRNIRQRKDRVQVPVPQGICVVCGEGGKDHWDHTTKEIHEDRMACHNCFSLARKTQSAFRFIHWRILGIHQSPCSRCQVTVYRSWFLGEDGQPTCFKCYAFEQSKLSPWNPVQGTNPYRASRPATQSEWAAFLHTKAKNETPAADKLFLDYTDIEEDTVFLVCGVRGISQWRPAKWHLDSKDRVCHHCTERWAKKPPTPEQKVEFLSRRWYTVMRIFSDLGIAYPTSKTPEETVAGGSKKSDGKRGGKPPGAKSRKDKTTAIPIPFLVSVIRSGGVLHATLECHVRLGLLGLLVLLVLLRRIWSVYSLWRRVWLLGSYEWDVYGCSSLHIPCFGCLPRVSTSEDYYYLL
ncbi:hypothetical protein PGQ11_010448 [Apiospora arundinis]|uniref:GATA-type domain-containing protein n=1 Tax=Apiospora arundinis TaxID=335852 RepID=A0ABR2IAH0_9PEZI